MNSITGSVTRSGVPARVYVRLLDRNGEFVGEVATDKDGSFTFFAAPGDWSVRVIGEEAPPDITVTLADSDAIPLSIAI